MNKNATILITGAAGFVGSCLLSYFNQKGFYNIIIVDEFETEKKLSNYIDKKYCDKIHRNNLFHWLKTEQRNIAFVFHLGARTDTTEFDYSVHEKLNLEYSKQIWNYCTENNIPLVYASSAATYGMGDFGYEDAHELVEKLQPLNPYGVSKNEFDKFVIGQKNQPPFWAGLKFFNVYGPNEFHKGRMASVVFHAFNQIVETGKVKLFKSHNPNYKDGEQLRDFIYVKDVIEICFWMMENKPASGLYNLGTGKAHSFNELAAAIFKSMEKENCIEFVDMPIDIREKYQYFTEAKMDKLRNVGYQKEFYSLEEGVKNYVNNYLIDGNYF